MVIKQIFLNIKKTPLPIILLLFGIIIVYANIFNAGFVYDDANFIVDNNSVKTWLTTKPWDFFLKPEISVWSGIYRPIRTLMFAVDYQIFGLNPAGYHIHNILWHMINTLLVFALLKKLFLSEKKSFLGALLFAVHPIQIESVTWISSRADIMFCAFVLWILNLFVNCVKTNKFTKTNIVKISTIFFIAMLCKETAIAVFPVLLTYDLLFSFSNIKQYIKSRYGIYLSLALVSAVYLLIRFNIFEDISQKPFWGGSAKANFLTMLDATVYYFRLLFYPTDLSIDYSTYPIIKSLRNPSLWLAVIFYPSMLGIFILQAKRKNFIFIFFLIFFVLFLLPTWNIFPISAIIAERFLYVPSIGFFAIMGWVFFEKIIKKTPLGVSIISTFILLLTVLSIYRNFDWQDDFHLWKSCVSEFPGNYKGHINLGTCYDKKGDFISGINEYYKLLSVKPHHATAYYNLGNNYWSLGLFEKSRDSFITAIRMKPDYLEAYNNLGSLYVDKYFFEEAKKCFHKILVRDPGYTKAHFNLAEIYFRHDKNYDMALYHLKKCRKHKTFHKSQRIKHMLKQIMEKKTNGSSL